MDDKVNIEATDPCPTVDEDNTSDNVCPDVSPREVSVYTEDSDETSNDIAEDDGDVALQDTPALNPKDTDISKSDVKKSKPSIVKDIYDFIEVFVFAVCSVMLVFTFLIRVCVVSGPSMENTLYNGEILLVSNLFYEPEYGDIVIFHQTSESSSKYNELIVKRVIAKGGDTVDIDFDTWTVTVNGKAIEEDYITLKGLPLRSDHEYPLTVPEGHLFLMGDNRNNSSDSRSDDIGFVDERRILGRVVLRVTPLSKFGSVE